jgi:hypothetical protein
VGNRFVIIMFGIEARVLLIASAKGIAWQNAKSIINLHSNFPAIELTNFLNEQGRKRVVW